MNHGVLQLAIAVLTIATLLAGLLGLAVRFVLLPYLKEHLIDPVQQTNKQVTENHHTNEEPTVLDRLSDVRSDVAGVRSEVRAIAQMHEGHMTWSEGWTRHIEQEIEHLKKKKKGWF